MSGRFFRKDDTNEGFCADSWRTDG